MPLLPGHARVAPGVDLRREQPIRPSAADWLADTRAAAPSAEQQLMQATYADQNNQMAQERALQRLSAAGMLPQDLIARGMSPDAAGTIAEDVRDQERAALGMPLDMAVRGPRGRAAHYDLLAPEAATRATQRLAAAHMLPHELVAQGLAPEAAAAIAEDVRDQEHEAMGIRGQQDEMRSRAGVVPFDVARDQALGEQSTSRMIFNEIARGGGKVYAALQALGDGLAAGQSGHPARSWSGLNATVDDSYDAITRRPRDTTEEVLKATANQVVPMVASAPLGGAASNVVGKLGGNALLQTMASGAGMSAGMETFGLPDNAQQFEQLGAEYPWLNAIGQAGLNTLITAGFMKVGKGGAERLASVLSGGGARTLGRGLLTAVGMGAAEEIPEEVLQEWAGVVHERLVAGDDALQALDYSLQNPEAHKRYTVAAGAAGLTGGTIGVVAESLPHQAPDQAGTTGALRTQSEPNQVPAPVPEQAADGIPTSAQPPIANNGEVLPPPSPETFAPAPAAAQPEPVAAPQTPTRSVTPLAEGPSGPDVLNRIVEAGGIRKAPANATGGEYDAYHTTLAQLKGAEKRALTGSEDVDRIAQQLGYTGSNSINDLWADIDRAVAARRATSSATSNQAPESVLARGITAAEAQKSQESVENLRAEPLPDDGYDVPFAAEDRASRGMLSKDAAQRIAGRYARVEEIGDGVYRLTRRNNTGRPLFVYNADSPPSHLVGAQITTQDDGIYIGLYPNGDVAGKLQHEMLHAAMDDGALSENELRVLAARSRSVGTWTEKDQKHYAELYRDNPNHAQFMLEEQAARYLQALREGTYQEGRGIWQRVKDWLADLMHTVGLAQPNARTLGRKIIDDGEIMRRQATAPKPRSATAPRANIDHSTDSTQDDAPVTADQVATSAREAFSQSFDALVSQYEALANSENGRILDVDVARELVPLWRDNYHARAEFTHETHQYASAFIKDLYQHRLLSATPGNVVFLAGGGGSGKGHVRTTTDLAGVVDGAEIVVDGVMSNVSKATRQIQAALENGHYVQVAYVHRPFKDAWNGIMQRAQRTGRMVPLDVALEAHAGAQETILALHDLFSDNPNVEITIYDNSKAQPELADIGLIEGEQYVRTGQTGVDEGTRQRGPTLGSLREWAESRLLHRTGRPGRPGRIHDSRSEAEPQNVREVQGSDSRSESRDGSQPNENAESTTAGSDENPGENSLSDDTYREATDITNQFGREDGPTVEERMDTAQKGAPRQPLFAAAADRVKDIITGFKRTFQHLDEDSDAEAVNILRETFAQLDASSSMATRQINEWIADFNKEELETFGNILAVQDIIRELEREESVYVDSPERIAEVTQRAKDKLQELEANAGDKVLERVKTRNDWQKDFAKELVDAGLQPAEVLEEGGYFHRQILAHMQDGKRMHTGGRGVRQVKRSSQKERIGGKADDVPFFGAHPGRDFNLRYEQAEFEYIKEMMEELARNEGLARLKERYDESQNAKDEATRRNQEAMREWWSDQYHYDEETINKGWDYDYRRRIGRASGEITSAVKRGFLKVPRQFRALENDLRRYGKPKSKEANALWFPFLGYLAGGNIAPTSSFDPALPARSIYKAIGERQAFMRETLGDNWTSWRRVAREMGDTYRTWQPEEGLMLAPGWTATADVITAAVVEATGRSDAEIADMMPPSITLPGNKLREALVVQGPKAEWLIPKQIAQQLDSIEQREAAAEAIGQAVGAAHRYWKRWILQQPLRALKYNINNTFSDADVAMTNPGIMKFVPRSAKDVWSYIVQDQRFGRQSGDTMGVLLGSAVGANIAGVPGALGGMVLGGLAGRRVGNSLPDLDEATESQLAALEQKDVLSSGVSVQEMADVSESTLGGLIRGERPGLISRYFDSVQRFTAWREAVLRIATARWIMGQLLDGGKWNGKRMYYASRQGAMDTLYDAMEDAARSDKEDSGQRAERLRNSIIAKLSREYLGDYGALSENGRWLRRGLMPFWSWLEINAPRYYRLFRNAGVEPGNSVAKRSAAVAGMTLKASALSAAVWAFNAIIKAALDIDDIEDPNSRPGKGMYIITGRGADGTIHYVKAMAAFSDALGLLGADNPMLHLNTIMNEAERGSAWRGVKEVAEEMGWSPVQTAIDGISPFIKTSSEVVTGMKVFPDARDPRPAGNATETIAGSLGLQDVYKAWYDKGDWQKVFNSVMYESDPGLGAYYEFKDVVRTYLERINEANGAPPPTARSAALAEAKKAFRDGNNDRAQRWMERFYTRGGSRDNVTETLERMAPMKTIPSRWRGAFLKQLTTHEKELFKVATKWHQSLLADSGDWQKVVSAAWVEHTKKRN